MPQTNDWNEAMSLCDFETEKDGSVLLTKDAPQYLEMLRETFTGEIKVVDEVLDGWDYWHVFPVNGVPVKRMRTGATTPTNLNATAQEIFSDVLEAMQNAEEIWGPGDDGYIPLMTAIAKEALERVSVFSEVLASEKRR